MVKVHLGQADRFVRIVTFNHTVLVREEGVLPLWERRVRRWIQREVCLISFQFHHWGCVCGLVDFVPILVHMRRMVVFGPIINKRMIVFLSSPRLNYRFDGVGQPCATPSCALHTGQHEHTLAPARVALDGPLLRRCEPLWFRDLAK